MRKWSHPKPLTSQFIHLRDKERLDERTEWWRTVKWAGELWRWAGELWMRVGELRWSGGELCRGEEWWKGGELWRRGGALGGGLAN